MEAWLLTYYGEVDFGISSLSHSEVHATSVNTCISFNDVLNGQNGWARAGMKVGSVPENILVRPPLSLLKGTVTSINARKAKEQH